MKMEIEGILKIIAVNTDKDFLEKENTELINLFMKINADDIPSKFINDIDQVITMLLMLGWANNEAEYLHLDMLHSRLKNISSSG